jgi:hypothetical protein
MIYLEDHVVHSQMGDENTTTVYVAELSAIKMVLQLVPSPGLHRQRTA